MDLGVSFDPNSEELKAGLLLPPGDYRLVCTNVEVKQSSGGKRFMQFSWQVFEGPGHNRRVWDDYYVYEGEPRGVAVAKARLGRLLDAAGIKEVFRQGEQMVGRKVIAKVVIEESEKYGQSNRIKGYKPLASAALVANGPQSFGGEAVVVSTTQAPNW